MARHRSTIKGAASFRRLIKALPDSAHRKIIVFLNGAGPVLVAKMQSEIPVLKKPVPNRTPGAARNSISYRVTPSTMLLKVGEINKRSIVFYAHILDTGRKAQTVTAKRRTGTTYSLKIAAMKPLHIVSSVRTQFRIDSLPGYRSLMDQILLDAARGAGND